MAPKNPWWQGLVSHASIYHNYMVFDASKYISSARQDGQNLYDMEVNIKTTKIHFWTGLPDNA